MLTASEIRYARKESAFIQAERDLADVKKAKARLNAFFTGLPLDEWPNGELCLALARWAERMAGGVRTIGLRTRPSAYELAVSLSDAQFASEPAQTVTEVLGDYFHIAERAAQDELEENGQE